MKASQGRGRGVDNKIGPPGLSGPQMGGRLAPSFAPLIGGLVATGVGQPFPGDPSDWKAALLRRQAVCCSPAASARQAWPGAAEDRVRRASPPLRLGVELALSAVVSSG